MSTKTTTITTKYYDSDNRNELKNRKINIDNDAVHCDKFEDYLSKFLK